MIRYIALILVVASMWINIGCSKSGNNPIAPLNMDDSSDLPVSMSLIGSDSISAIGVLGAFELTLSDDYSDAELIPLRREMIGESTIVNGGAYFTQFPCVDCLQIKSIGLDENIIIEFSIRHPYEEGNPNKAPSLTNRLDLDIFDVALVFQPNNRTPVDFNALDVSAYAGMLLNADGYTKETSSIIGDDVLVPFKNFYNPFEFVNRIRMGDRHYPLNAILNKGTHSFNLFVTFSYGISADPETRLEPTYFVPEFNRKSALKIKVYPPELFHGQAWVEGDTTTEREIQIYIYDMNHGAEVSDCYPDYEHTDRLSAPSDIESVLVEIPGMIDSVVSVTTSIQNYYHPTSPILYIASIANENNLSAGNYYGLVKVLDSRIPGEGFSPDKIIDSPDGSRYEFYPIDEFATYQIFDVHVISDDYDINAQVVGNIRGIGFCNLIEVQDNLAFVGKYDPLWDDDRGYDLTIIDISDISNPQIASQLDYRTVFDIEVNGDILYVTGMFDIPCTFAIYDISNPYDPAITAILSDYEFSYLEMEIDGDYAYIQRYFGMEIYNISNPYNPFLVASLDDIGYPNPFSMLVKDNLLYISTDKLSIYDVSNPHEPVLLNQDDSPGIGKIIDIKDNYLFTISDIYFAVFDISDIFNPVFVTSVLNNYDFNDGVITDDYAYLIHGDKYGPSKFTIVNIHDPLNPFLVDNFQLIGGFELDFFNSNYLVTANGSMGIQFVDISNPVDPFIENEFKSFIPVNVELKDDYAIISTMNNKNNCLVDISDANNPAIVGAFLDDESSIIEVYGNLLIYEKNDDIHILDINDPLNPSELGSIAIVGSINSAIMHNEHLYVAITDNSGYLLSIDISNPNSPVLISQTAINHTIDKMEIIGNYIFTANFWNGGPYLSTMIIDISEPENPVLVNNIALHCQFIAFELSSESAYIIVYNWTSHQNELQIWDISDPINIFLKNVIYLGQYLNDLDIEVSEPYVYISHHTWYPRRGLISVFDISNPDNPVIVDSVECYTETMKIRDNYIYALDPVYGFSIVKLWD